MFRYDFDVMKNLEEFERYKHTRGCYPWVFDCAHVARVQGRRERPGTLPFGPKSWAGTN